jgi:hypothetical protein
VHHWSREGDSLRRVIGRVYDRHTMRRILDGFPFEYLGLVSLAVPLCSRLRFHLYSWCTWVTWMRPIFIDSAICPSHCTRKDTHDIITSCKYAHTIVPNAQIHMLVDSHSLIQSLIYSPTRSSFPHSFTQKLAGPPLHSHTVIFSQ